MSLVDRVTTRFRVIQAYLKQALYNMTWEEALHQLGFKPGDSPTESEINQAHRSRIRDLAKSNPGAFQTQHGEAIKPFNIAKEVLLEGQQSAPDSGYGVKVTPEGYVEPEEVKTSFNEAKAKGHVPANVNWLFVTDTHHSGYSSDEFTNSNNGWVACGDDGEHWVFVTVEHTYYRAYQPGGYYSENVPQMPKDIWTISTMKHPKKGPQPEAAELYGGVTKAWKAFGGMEKKFNSKVIDANGWTFQEKPPTGKEVTIKMLLSNTMGAEFTGKMAIEVEYREAPWGERDKAPAGYFKSSEYSSPYQLIFTINGRDYTLEVADIELIHKKFRIGSKDFIDRVFGERAYGSRPKSLTKNRDGKTILEWLSTNLAHVPDWVRQGLTQAAAQLGAPKAAPARGRGRRYSYDRSCL